MFAHDVEFHNVAELHGVSAGLQLHRFPATLRGTLGARGHTRGRFYAHRIAGSEVRFVAESKVLSLGLTAVEADAEVFVYRGDFAHSRHSLRAGVSTVLFLEGPAEFSSVRDDALRGSRFAPNVWRIAFNQDARIIFNSLENYGEKIRPPGGNEKPRKRWLAYGSSITFGGNAALQSSTYVQQAARRLGVDVFNKGLPGSCLCELAMAEYLMSEQWDFATFEIGVNMVGLFEPDGFHRQVAEFLAIAREKLQERILFILNIFPNKYDYCHNVTDTSAGRTAAFNKIVQGLVEGYSDQRIRFIDGREVLKDLDGLTVDLVHPSDDGHIAMGENLATLISQKAPELFAHTILCDDAKAVGESSV